MKILPYFLTAIVGTVSFTALASQELNSTEAASHQEIGRISVSGLEGSPDDVVHALARKAAEQNAPYFRVIEVANPGKSSDWIGNADLYR
ncbi:DUF1471 domain-containing protein [Sodalis sp. dw_96]|uniref:DUF1471 domain-containing protein n=1 Tax=Sodalis sp. dw_96 TaxID=2719794 RepID=UPI001BD5EBD4|nr:DUF1471 domain-containing protein [Sodalis sp. dw_96]